VVNGLNYLIIALRTAYTDVGGGGGLERKHGRALANNLCGLLTDSEQRAHTRGEDLQGHRPLPSFRREEPRKNLFRVFSVFHFRPRARRDQIAREMSPLP
jgi:hypothetical protein